VVPPGDTQPGVTPFGYDRFETNFGKPIPHFKKYNSMMPLWLKTTPGDPTYNYGLAQLSKVYEGIGHARRFSPALRSSNRYFLNLNDNSPHGQIFSVAKFETRNAAPNSSDVVLAFVNLDRNATPATIGTNKFNVNFDTDANGMNDLGIKPLRQYNVKNIAAYLGTDPNRRNNFLIPGGIAGSELISQGLYVSMNRVPQIDGDWATIPYEAQYLKLYDVTPPPAPAAPRSNLALFGTVLGNQVAFTWVAAGDPDGGVFGFHLQIGTTPGGSDLFDAQTLVTSQSIIVPFGTTLYARVQQINSAGISGPYSSSSASVLALDPVADGDLDGQSNGSEHTAGTNPLSATSVLKATATSVSGNNVNVTVATVADKIYQLETSTSLAPLSWTTVGIAATASGPSTVFTHTGGAGNPLRFYRVRVVP